MKKNADINKRHREIEKGINLTVLSAAAQSSACHGCGQTRLIFYCHLFREHRVEALCKECATLRAGGEEKVWVRTEHDVREHWRKDARLKRGRAIAGGGSDAVRPEVDAMTGRD
jgi:hypothetical protein